jgi:uncharacterized repeat protein (TIGR01451 family)/fimbrial isopeptide formation D2 family protein
MIGESLTFTATFDNTSGDTGYGPFIDLVFPYNGSDGAHGAAAPDGLSFVSATYLGASVTFRELTFPDDDGAGAGTTGHVLHPYAVDSAGNPLWVYGTAGDRLVVLQLPFGSFTGAQPAAAVTINAMVSNLADLNAALTVRARAGFQFGNTAVSDPATDPSIVSAPSTSSSTWPVTGSTSPTVLRLRKVYSGPEDETATGPNYVRQYTVIANIAAGQTITNLDLTDVLPGNLQFVSVDNVSPAGSVVTTPSTTTPGGTLTRRIASVTGTTGTNDASMTFSFYVPLLDASLSNVIVPATGDDAQSPDDGRAEGDWTPVDARDLPAQHLTSNAVPVDHLLTDKSIAIQKSVAIVGDVVPAGFTPGDTLEYTLTFQISDYFAFQNVRITSDVISDGQHLDPGFTPTYTVTENGTATSGSFDAADWTVTTRYSTAPVPVAPIDGTTSLTFDISQALVRAGRGGQLLGGLIQPAAANDGATTGQIRFRTTVLDKYVDMFPSGSPSLDEGDSVGNAVTITGDVLDNGTLLATGFDESDGSSTGATIAEGALSKNVYAINGSTTMPNPLRMAAGDWVTYRIHYALVTSDFELLHLIDFLPLPVFRVSNYAWSKDPAVSDTAPIPGQWKYLTTDTYHVRPGAVDPGLTVDAAANALDFYYGTHEDSGNQASAIDLVFTVAVSSDPFADGLLLTNQVRHTDQNTQNEPAVGDAIVQIQLTEPVLRITKGVVATDRLAGAVFAPSSVGPVVFNAPGTLGARWAGIITSTGLVGNPVDSNLSGVDAGDKVTYAIVVENTGTGLNGAFDVQVKDALPAGYTLADVSNIRVADGTGAVIATTNVGGGAGLFDLGIELTDPGATAVPTGALDPYDASSGRNVAVITYDLTLKVSLPATSVLTNTSSLLCYAGLEGGANHVVAPLTDPASVTAASPSLVKTRVGSELVNGNNTSAQAVVGEIITYQLTLTVPEGVAGAVSIVDTLDGGLAYVGPVIATNSNGAQVTLTGSTSPVVTNSGQTLTFSLGDITDANSDNITPETITLEYPVVVLSVGGNVANTQLNNSARMTWTGGSPVTVSAPNTQVIQPSLILVKSVVPGSGDAGDEVTFSISVTNVNAGTGTDAYDVVVSDAVPAGLTYVAGSLAFTPGVPAAPAPVLDDTGAPTLTASWGTLPKNTTGTITFRATLTGAVLPGQSIQNTAGTTWTTLPGTPSPSPRSAYNANSTERTLTTTSQATVTVNSIAPVKSLAATSEPSTTGNDVTIGEIVRYHLSVLLPEGFSPAFQIVDALPAGLTFLNDGTAKAAFVATGTGAGAGIVSSDAGLGILPQVSGSSAAVTPTFVLPTANVSPATFIDGTDPTFACGDLTNHDRDADSEYLVLEFNAIVSNVAANTTNRNLDNTFTTRINGAQSGLPSNSVRVTVRQPALATTKVVTHAPADAGDTVTYRITVTNSGNATAFDVVVNDPLDPTNHYIDLFNASDVVVGGTAVGVANNSNPATDVVNVTATSLATGGTMTVDITAHVVPGLPTGQITIPNTSTTTWTSLPGSGTPDPNGTGSAAGVAGGTTGERTGTGTSPNMYTSSSSAVINLPKPVRLVKTIVAINGTAVTDANRPFRVQPGDVVTFQLKLENRGATPLLNTLQLTDTLPAGWNYLAASSSWRLTNGSAPAFPGTSVTPSIVGQVLTWTPGQALAASDDAGMATGTANDTLWLQFRATVTSAAASSVGGTANVNTANIIATDVPAPAIDLTDNWDSTLVYRPELLLVKSVYSINGSTANVTQAQAGDVVRYRIIVRNTSVGADAKALVVTDTLPVGVTYVNGSSLATWSNAGSSAVDPAGTTTRTWSYASSIVKPGENLTLFYSVLVSSTTPLGRATNTASASGTDGQGQSYAAVGPDRVSGTAQAQFDVYKPVLRLTKTASAAGVGVGTPVDFTVTVENLDSYAWAQSINLSDTLPSGWTYTAGTSYLVRSNGTAPVSWGLPIADPIGLPLTWTLNEVLQPTDDQGGMSGSSLDTLWLKLTAVPGVASEGRGNVNTAQATFADASGTAMPSVADSVTICVGSPRLEMTKTVDQNVTEVGQARTFLLRTINQNAVSALAVNVDDYLPAGWEYVAGSAWWNLNSGTVPVGGTAIVPTVAETRLTFATNQTIVGTDDGGPATGTATDTLWVQFQARATSAAVQGINTNTAGATGVDPGSPSRPVGSNISSAAVTLNKPQIAISKSVDVPTPGVGSVVTFTVLVTNTGNENLTGGTVTDALPAGLTFVSASGGGIHAAGVVTWSGLVVTAGGSVSLTVNARVDKNTPSGQALINSASVSGQDSGGNTITAGPATAVVTIAAPALSVAKSGSPNPVKAGQTVTWTITVTNTGLQAASGVSVADIVPAGLTFVSADAGGSLVAGVVTWSGLSVPSAGSLTLHWTGTVASPIADNTVIPNTATVDSTEAGPVTSPPAAVVVSSAPQLNICKAGSQDPVKAGNEFTYTIRYANNSTMNVTGATIVEVYPVGVTFVSASPSPTSGDNTWLIGNLGAGSSGIITITVRVDAGVVDGTILTNVVSITSDQTQTVQAQAITRVGTGAALQISKSDLKDPVAAGVTATYTLSFANSGSTDATGVQLVDDYSGFAGLPILGGGTADMTLNSWSVTSGSVSFTMTQDVVNHTLTFVPTAGTIPGRATGTITVVFDTPANVMDGTTRTNSVALSSNETNPVSDSESTTISSAPALHVTKTASPAVQAGGLITYTIEYWNDGAANATGVVLTESYSPLVGFVSATVIPDTGTNNVWTIGLVINDAVHHSIVVTCRAMAPLADGTVIPNTVTLDSDQTAPQTAAASTTVGSAPVLTMAKSVTGSPVIAGQNLAYTMTIGNTGNADATGAVVTDATPANTTFVSARFISGTGSISSPAVGTAGTVTWTLGAPLSPGAQVVVELVVKTNTPLDNGLTVTNTAAVNCVEDPTGVTGTVPATVTSAPVLHLVKDAPANVNAGETITYTLHVTNTGNMNAHGVIVTDATPVHTTFVSARFVSGGTGTVVAPAVGGTGPVTWALDPAQTVTVGSELVLELIVQADSPLPNGTLIPNAATVVSAEILTPVTADALTIVGSSPVLTVTKTVLPASFVPGDSLTYTITLRNDGNMVATGVTINDSTPLNTTFLSASWLTGTGTIVSPAVGATGLVTWTPTGGTLGIGQEIMVRLMVATPRGLPVGTIIINTAIADSAETERVTSTVQAVANGAPLLILTKTAFPTSQKPGGMVTWALLLRNIGTAPATNVVIAESYDGAFTYQFANPSPDAGMNNRWTIGTVPVDMTIAVTIIGQLSESTSVTTPPVVIGNTATVACSELAPIQASAAITVLDVRFSSIGLRNFKSVTPTGAVTSGATLAYAITYTNTGNHAASNVTVVDYLDPNLDESTLHIGSGGTYNSVSREIAWTVPSVPAMGSGVVSFTVRVRLGFGGGIIYDRASIGVKGVPPTITNTVTSYVYPMPVVIQPEVPVVPPTPPASIEIGVSGTGSPVCLGAGLDLGLSLTNGKAPFTWNVTYGDGTPAPSGATSDRSLALHHQFVRPGTYSLTVTVRDATGMESTLRTTAIVQDCTPAEVNVYHHNFFIGYPDKPFLPERSISRAEVAGALSRALGLGWSVADPRYPDLKYTHWGTGFIALMQEEGIMMGDTLGTFRPDAFITRAEAAAVFLRLLKIAPSTNTAGNYPDVPAGHWAAGVIAAMKSVGLLEGYPDGTFRPDAQIKRSEFAVLACRALGRQMLPVNQLEDIAKLVHWDDVPETYWAYWAIVEVSTPHVVTNPERLDRSIVLKHKTVPLYTEVDTSTVAFVTYGDRPEAVVPVDGMTPAGSVPLSRPVLVQIINQQKP